MPVLLLVINFVIKHNVKVAADPQTTLTMLLQNTLSITLDMTGA